MEYSIRELSRMAGVSARTLRYYDEIGLLAPLHTSGAGYRFYGKKQVELLQQILFYRERGLELQQIRNILYDSEFDTLSALEEHLFELQKKQKATERLIENVNRTIASMKGDYEMKDYERFEEFKKNSVLKNEKLYGGEIRKRYGDTEVDASNRQMLNMTQEEYERFRQLEREIKERLETTVKSGISEKDEEAYQIVKLHKEWIMMTWKKCTPEAHKGLGDMYDADERFRKYYDENVSGCAAFLAKAIEHHTGRVTAEK